MPKDNIEEEFVRKSFNLEKSRNSLEKKFEELMNLNVLLSEETDNLRKEKKKFNSWKRYFKLGKDYKLKNKIENWNALKGEFFKKRDEYFGQTRDFLNKEQEYCKQSKEFWKKEKQELETQNDNLGQNILSLTKKNQNLNQLNLSLKQKIQVLRKENEALRKENELNDLEFNSN